MPKRERRGAEMRPARVVAPTRVKRGSSRRMERALAPWSIMMSMTKSSMAEYRYSSTVRCMRWISSMKRTSPRLSEVSRPARSAGLSMIGPEVTLTWTPMASPRM